MARLLLLALIIACFVAPTVATAQERVGDDILGEGLPADESPTESAPEFQPHKRPTERVEEAVEVLNEMRSDRLLGDLLARSQGVFIVPDYGEASFVIGTGGGNGVLFLREDGSWGNPAFYQVSSLSAGLQLGVIAGSFALVLVSERAAARFRRPHNFSLSLEAGMVVVDRSAWARGDVGEDLDVLLWSNTEGLLAELSIGMNSIIWQAEANEAYYGYPVSLREVLSGEAVNPYHEDLQQALLEPY